MAKIAAMTKTTLLPTAGAERRAAPKPDRAPSGGRSPYSADGGLQ